MERLELRADDMHDTHISGQLRALHNAVSTLAGALNYPGNDERLIAAAGICSARDLFRPPVVI